MVQKPLPKPRNAIVRLTTGIAGAAVFVVLFTTVLLANALQALSLLIRPFSQRLFRKINREIANGWWGLCTLGSQYLLGVHVTVLGDPIPARENAIVFANHQQMPDIVVLFALAWSKHRLGDMKWMVKDIIKYVPGVGWGMVFLDCLFLKRNWDADRNSILSTFARFRDARIPLWLVSFPEGTRLTPEKLERSQTHAASNGLPRTQNVLLPRPKGFAATVMGLAGHCTAVYDVTIVYPKGIPTIWQYMQGLAKEVTIHVKRFPIESLPSDMEGISRWLIGRFVEKDGLVQEIAEQAPL